MERGKREELMKDPTREFVDELVDAVKETVWHQELNGRLAEYSQRHEVSGSALVGVDGELITLAYLGEFASVEELEAEAEELHRALLERVAAEALVAGIGALADGRVVMVLVTGPKIGLKELEEQGLEKVIWLREDCLAHALEVQDTLAKMVGLEKVEEESHLPAYTNIA